MVCFDGFDFGYTLCTSGNGEVYSFGKNSKRAHGHKEEHVFSPTKIPSLRNIKSIDCGCFHTVCLDNDGIAFTFGCNGYGELGVGKEVRELEYTYIPQKLNLPLIKQVSCGNSFTICLSEDGELYSFGYNYFGQLGKGDNENCNYPNKIESLKDIDFIECGGNSSICKSFDNTIYVWGCDGQGQLGIGTLIDHNIPINGNLLWPNNVVDIKCGFAHLIVLTSNQKVFSCGSNDYNELGRGVGGVFLTTLEMIESLSEIVRIQCGDVHTMCIDNYDRIYIFGSNLYGQLGLDYKDAQLDYKDINIYNGSIKPIKHPSLSNIIDISSKGNHSFVKTSHNEIYAFGRNCCSQLGKETSYINQNIPMQVLNGDENIWNSNIYIPSQAKSARK